MAPGFPGDGDVVGALARADAARAVRAYRVAVRTGPVFAVAEQADRGGGGCGDGRVHSAGCLGHARLGPSPGSSPARYGRGPGSRSGRAALLAAARLLGWERRDEVTAAERRFRVARVEEFIRLGPDGPEPPRPTDADAWPPGRGHRAPDPARGFVVSGEIPGSPALLGEPVVMWLRFSSRPVIQTMVVWMTMKPTKKVSTAKWTLRATWRLSRPQPSPSLPAMAGACSRPVIGEDDEEVGQDLQAVELRPAVIGGEVQ
jgi:Family of unknown function (DUF5954)